MTTKRGIIKTIECHSAKARLFILEREDGFYRFEGEKQVNDEDEFGPYWTACDMSGLYATAEEAEAAAHRDVIWLRDQSSNDAGTDQ